MRLNVSRLRERVGSLSKKCLRSWHWIIFAVLVFCSVRFLLTPGLYNFVDSGYFPLNASIIKHLFISKMGLFSNTDGFYFGYDNSQRAFSALSITGYQYILISVFGSTIGQILFFVNFYLLSFYFGLRLLRIVCSENSEAAIRIGSLFIAFNPFSLLVITLSSVGMVYAAFIVAVYAILAYMRDGRYRYLLLLSLSSIQIVYYLRFIPIIILLLCLLGGIFWKRLKQLFNLRRFLIGATVSLLCIVPFIVGNVASLFFGSNIVSNYQNGFQRFEQANYAFKGSFLFSLSVPGGFTTAPLSYFYNPDGRVGVDRRPPVELYGEIYKGMQILFTAGLLCFVLMYSWSKAGETRKRILYLVTSILFFIALNTVGFFVSLENFTFLNKTLLIFLYNDYGFLQFGEAFLFAFLIVLTIDELRKIGDTKKALGLSSVVVLYCIFGTFPYLLETSFYGLQKIKNIPNDYGKIFLDGSMSIGREAALFIPYYWIRLDWAPHFINVNFLNDSRYQSLIIPNFRSAGADFISLYNDVYSHLDEPGFKNLELLNVKSLFLFKSVIDANDEMDAFGIANKQELISGFTSQLETRSDVKLEQENETISQYRFSDADAYDFLLYSPRALVREGLSDFFSTTTDISNAPVLISTSTEVSASVVGGSAIAYKWGLNNSNKYYIRLNDNGSQDDISIQLNQMYLRGWVIYESSKKEYDGAPCTSEPSQTLLTQNSSCSYDSLPLDMADARLLFQRSIPAQHYVGNLFGNLFQIKQSDVVRDSKGDIYLVLYFRGQIYYELALVLCFLTIGIVAMLCLVEEILRRGNKR